MRRRILVVRRGVRGGKFKKVLRISVPERQSRAEERVLQFVLESLNVRSSLVPFTLNNLSTMKIARHLLFNRTGSPLTLFAYINAFSYFCSWIKAEPDELVNKCRDSNGDVNPKGIARMTHALEDYIDHLRERRLSPCTVRTHVKNVVTAFRINGVELKLPFGLIAWRLYYERAPSREELQQILDLANLRERVIITLLAVSGLRVGTLLKLQYRDVKDDLERGIIPIRVHIDAGSTKAKRRSYDTFFNEEASECLKAYFIARRSGTEDIPPEQIRDDSPLIRAHRFKQARTVAVSTVCDSFHNLCVKAGLLEKGSCRRYELRTHSLRRFFRTQMASLGVGEDYIDYMMGRAVKDRYHDVRMKGVEYLRGMYVTSGIRIRPKIKMNKFDALKEILQTWGLDPQKILTREALDQITPATTQEQTDGKGLLLSSKAPQNPQPNSSLLESTGAQR
jgi:integrase